MALDETGSKNVEGPLGEISPGVPDRSVQSELFDGDQNLNALQEQVSILQHRTRSLEIRLQQRSYMGLLSATALKMCIDDSNRLKFKIDILTRTYETFYDLSCKVKSLDEEKQNLEIIFQKIKKEVKECNEKKKRLMGMLRDGKGKGIETGSKQNESPDRKKNPAMKLFGQQVFPRKDQSQL